MLGGNFGPEKKSLAPPPPNSPQTPPSPSPPPTRPGAPPLLGFSIENCPPPPRRRAKPGRFGSLAFAMKKRAFRRTLLLNTSRASTKMWQILGVCLCPKSGKQSIWRQRPPSARKQSTKKLPDRPGLCPCTAPPPAPRTPPSQRAPGLKKFNLERQN